MVDFGGIVLTRFPFTDLSGAKVRPALVVSRDSARRLDVVVAFITSNSQTGASPMLWPSSRAVRTVSK